MIEAKLNFPKGFLWGTATSAHQVEGGNANNDWWLWEKQSGRISDATRSGNACEWWKGRWNEDFERASSGGQNAHRLSVEWSRIEPTPGVWDEEALLHYREMIKGAKKRGLKSMLTLHHFTNPAWAAELGGWTNAEMVVYFERYVRKVASSLIDLVDHWITINEPNTYLYNAHIRGTFPPANVESTQAIQAAQHLALGHAAAYHALHEMQAEASVGLAHHYRDLQSTRGASALGRWFANSRSKRFNELFPTLLRDGQFRLLGKRIALQKVKRTQDFFGLSYFSTALDLSNPKESFNMGFPEPGIVARNEIAGIWRALAFAQAFKLPIFITADGVDDVSDELRRATLAKNLRHVWKAANFNWKLRGYFHWSLVDHFSWQHGWSKRFGLWALDPETQKRKKRPSADFYADICRSNSLTSEMVALHSPAVFEVLFPDDQQREFVGTLP